MRLEKRLAAAQAAGYGSPSPQSSPSAASNSAAAAAAAMAAGLSGALGGSGWASVSSSGPAAELTAADLATGAAARPPAAAARVADTDAETAVDSVQLEQSSESVAGDAAAAGTAGLLADGAACAAVVKAGAGIGDDAGKVSLGSAGLHRPDGGSSEGGRIAAYRPSRGDTYGGADLQQEVAPRSGNTSSSGVISAPASSTGGGGGSSAGGAAAPTRGAIDQAAAQQLRSLVAQLQAELTPEQLAGEYAEVRNRQLHMQHAVLTCVMLWLHGASPGPHAAPQSMSRQTSLDSCRTLVIHNPACGAVMQCMSVPLCVHGSINHSVCLFLALLQVCSDWDKPFDLTDDEKGQFRQVVPLEVTGLKDVLCAKPHTAEVRARLRRENADYRTCICTMNLSFSPCWDVSCEKQKQFHQLVLTVACTCKQWSADALAYTDSAESCVNMCISMLACCFASTGGVCCQAWHAVSHQPHTGLTGCIIRHTSRPHWPVKC